MKKLIVLFLLALIPYQLLAQQDPVGQEPIDIAKAFIQALIENDQNAIERLTMDNERLIGFIYKNEQVRLKVAERATLIDPRSWKQTHHPGGGATVTAQIEEPQVGRYQIGFELSTTRPYGQSRERVWFVRAFY